MLANAWDAASARAVQEAGFPAVATASAAVAPVLGYADGEETPVAEMLAAVARIARAVEVPVTADMERGYGLEPAEFAERLLATGAVGCNLEDLGPGGLRDPHEQASYLSAVRAAAGQDLVINARVDTFLPEGGTLDDALHRAALYLEAGADCVYPILAPDPAALAKGIGGPVNVLYTKGSPALADLAAMGVARVSFGHVLHEVTQSYTAGLLKRINQGEDPYM
ncbi:isocitrate lyase/phosphoenolpyruvate mutase family protein [Nonomuraea longicatena]|uniref:Isocitrate lyase/phosphoenolpyruvate mutase family protein n=1 Tax=Nonomuraea longicatena TaxID=83682 RepID=A0ABN1PIU7_9ACTN